MKMKILKAICLILAVLFFASVSFAANISPTEVIRYRSSNAAAYYTWTLITNKSTVSTWDSDAAIGASACGEKTLEIKTSGTVNMSVTIKEGDNAAAVKTISLTEAGTKRYATSHPLSKLYLMVALTSGTVDTITLECYSL